jgi:hypothetical protein
MCFDIIYHEKEMYIESTIFEDFNFQVMDEMVPAIAKVVLEKNCYHVLLDWRKGKINLTTLQIYDTPARLKAEFEKYGVNILKMKRAYLINKIDSDSYFFETMMKNNNQTFTLFLDREEAVRWLLA